MKTIPSLLIASLFATLTFAVWAYLNRLQQVFSHKPIVVAEIGWPSRGRTRESAVASDSNEALFLRRAEQEQMIYYVMEAFDQPWKAYLEGAVGSYWGVYDVNRHPKFAFTAPIVRVPEWHIQSVPYACSLLVSLASAFPLPARLLGTDYRAIKASGKRAETDPAS
jgi:hypothetical protein